MSKDECLKTKPKVVVGLKGSISNSFVDNAAYRNFLHDHDTFQVSTFDMESSALVMVGKILFLFSDISKQSILLYHLT